MSGVDEKHTLKIGSVPPTVINQGTLPPPKRHELFVTFHPPSQHNDGNQSQDFSISMRNWDILSNEAKEIYEAIGAPPDGVRYIGANVRYQAARFFPPVETDYQVPLVLHNEGGIIQVRYVLNDAVKWNRLIGYNLQHPIFQNVIRANKSSQTGVVKIPTVTEVVAQEWEYVGDSYSMTLKSMDKTPPFICVSLEIGQVHVKSTQKPLSFFGGERVWAVRKCAIFVDAADAANV